MKSASQKLGLKPGLSGWVVGGTMEGFSAEQAEAPDVILAYAADQAALESMVPGIVAAYRPGGSLWIAYPKKSGRLKSDLARDEGWASAQAAGLLPVSQVSIDQDWTAIRLRFRDEIRTMTRRADWPGMAGA
jgi:hypothetical protein